MTVVFDKSELIKLEPEILEQWIQENCYTLVGSAIFTKNNSLGSKLVRWGEKHLFAKCKDDDCFVPSHTGSIIEFSNDLYIFDMKPPRASVQPLRDYLIETDEDYKLVLRDFKIDTKMFSLNCQFHVGEFYPYLSALRSVFTKRQSKWNMHCSEFHARMLKLAGHNFPVGFNYEITPDELYHYFVGEEGCNFHLN